MTRHHQEYWTYQKDLLKLAGNCKIWISQVPWLPKCPSTRVPQVLEWPSVKYPSSARVLECPSSALWVSLEWFWCALYRVSHSGRGHGEGIPIEKWSSFPGNDSWKKTPKIRNCHWYLCFSHKISLEKDGRNSTSMWFSHLGHSKVKEFNRKTGCFRHCTVNGVILQLPAVF